MNAQGYSHSESNGLNEWTIMIYLGGDNNLSEECIWAIKEMLRVGLTDGVSVIAQFDTRVPAIPTRRYDIRRILERTSKVNGAAGSAGATADLHRLPGFDADGVLDNFGLPQPGERSPSAAELKRFIVECAEAHPARRYMLVLSGHGSGAVGDFLLIDEDPPGFLSIPRLRWAIAKANKALMKMDPPGKIDILGLDACAMSMAEIGYELRDQVDYMVGAEGFVKNTGWPYHRIIETLNSNPNIEAADLAGVVVQKYTCYYSDYVSAGVSVDLAACDLSRHRGLREAVRYLAALLTNSFLSSPQCSPVVDAVILAHWRTQSYKFEEYVDLWDFCDLLEGACEDEAVQKACRGVKDAIAGRGVDSSANGGGYEGESAIRQYVLDACFSGPGSQHSHGLSVYFPWVEDRLALNKYRKLSFPEETGWGSFLSVYVNKTRRAPRRDGKQVPMGVPRALEGIEDVDRYITDVDRYTTDVDRYTTDVDRYTTDVDRYTTDVDKYTTDVDKIIAANFARYITDVDKGILGLLAKVKNPPVEYFRHACNGEKEGRPAEPGVAKARQVSKS
jgi:hypothetical protein